MDFGTSTVVITGANGWLGKSLVDCLLNGIKERTKFIFYLAITVGLYVNLGFRYRLFLLFLPLALIYFFYKKIKPSIRLLVLSLIHISEPTRPY